MFKKDPNLIVGKYKLRCRSIVEALNTKVEVKAFSRSLMSQKLKILNFVVQKAQKLLVITSYTS